MTTTSHQPCGTMHTMSPSLVHVLNAFAVILIVLGFIGFIAALVPTVETRIPRLYIGAITMLVLGLAFGVVLFVLESAY